MYETREQTPITHAMFVRRLFAHMLAALTVLVASVGLGMLGYMGFEQLSATDAFLNTTMLLGGMGPVDAPQTEAGKLFAGCFALYAGLVFIVIAALLLTPAVHRLLHRFHWSDDA